MNKLKSFLRKKLKEEFVERSIYIDESKLEILVNSVILGNYAFKIIYDEHTPGTDLLYTYSEHYPIKHEFVIFPTAFPHGFSDLVSIDGGERYQWNKREVIKIDKNLVRSYKIEDIIN